MYRLRLLLAALVAVSCNFALAKYSIEEAGVRVVFPSESKKTMKMAMADFGKPRYGGSLRGQLVYPMTRHDGPNKMECDPSPCQYGCSPFAKAFPSPYKIAKEPGKFYIMMLDRGPRNLPGTSACLFLDKVYNAQLAGADAVLVANDVPDDMSTAVAPEDDDTAKELESISISAAMITQEDATYLKGLLAGNLSVTLQLTWASAVPTAKQVAWEFWTSSEDGCGPHCVERIDFTRAIRDQAVKLEQANQTRFTPRYFLWDCPADFLDSDECKRNCVANGTYCALDPENQYTGLNVIEMNIRGICFFTLAAAAHQPWLWWDYALGLASNCSMAAGTFNVACAGQVFDAVGGAGLAANNYGRSAWDSCAKFDPNATSVPVLEETLKAQLGDESRNITGVGILPSIRVNNVQYRGSLEAGPVLRAICSGFPAGQEPEVCNADWVSEDDCKPGELGYKNCMTGQFAASGQTKCVNTFRGYTCECQAGMQLFADPVTLEERCEDTNECLATTIPMTNPSCSCDRCACVNKVGSYNCTGPLPNMCTAERNFGRCWRGTFNGTLYNACVDTFPDFKALASRGEANETGPWFKCQCPKCFTDDGAGGCTPRCDLAVCDQGTGYCPGKDDGGKTADTGSGGGGSSGGGSSKSGGNGGGASAGFLIVVALGSALLTGVVVMAANRYLMRQRMGDEIRDIMAQYMPLQERERNALLAAAAAGGARGAPRVIRPDSDSDEEGAVGPYGWAAARPAAPAAGPLSPGAAPAAGPTLAAATQRNVWGPPLATTASTAAGPSNSAEAAVKGPAAGVPVAAAAPARPAVDVFTISRHEDAAGGAAAAGRTTPGGGAGADPLLGLELGGSTNLDDGVRRPSSRDNPFL